MSYKSITTFLHDPDARMDSLEFAIRAARHWDAHLHVVCAGIDRVDPGFFYAGTQAIAVQQNLELAQLTAAKLEPIARARLETEDIAWDVESVTMLVSGLRPFLANHMRFFDLAILPLPYGEGQTEVDQDAFEACLFGAAIPVLVVPENAEWKSKPDHVLVAWDNGAEALAAIRAAKPITVAAAQTDIYVIGPPMHGSDRSDPGGRVAQMLVRAGAKVEISVAARTRSRISDQLLQRASETGADVIVMGAYSHSRLRESVLGGVTISMLQSATVPVFMAR